jgi:hypothetical protein
MLRLATPNPRRPGNRPVAASLANWARLSFQGRVIPTVAKPTPGRYGTIEQLGAIVCGKPHFPSQQMILNGFLLAATNLTPSSFSRSSKWTPTA